MPTEHPLAGCDVALLVQNLPVPFDRRVWMESTALQRAGARVTVICPADDRFPTGEFEIEGVKVHRYAPPREARGLTGYLNEYVVSLVRMNNALRKARESGSFDVVHFCNPPDLLYVIAARLKRRDGAKLIFDQHDLGPELVQAKHMPFSKALVAIARYFERRTYRAADRVIATNESYKRIAIERGGFSPSDVTVVRSAPPVTWADDVVKKDWHEGHQYLVGYVGVMGRQEGIEYLLDAIRALRQDAIDVHLALVGSGPDRSRLEDYAKEIGVSENVRFYGRVSDGDLKSILADSDVCVNPDEVNPMNNLSTMNKIVEYMALARPIVQFDVKEGRFSAQDASAYAKANDAQSLADEIQALLLNPDRRRAMASAGRQRFEKFLCWENQAQSLVGAYAELTTRKRAEKG